MSARATVIAIVCTVLCTAAASAPDPTPGALTGLSLSLVKIEAVDTNGHAWVGTGVAIALEHVVTSCHVISRGESITVQSRGLRRTVMSQLSDTQHDVCILTVPGLPAQPAQLGSSSSLDVGTPVWAFGFEGGVALHSRAGIVRALHAYDGASVIESTTAFTSGASGGALFDTRGRLVGILTYRLRGDRGSYFSVPVDWFTSRLDDMHAYVAVAPLAGAEPFWQRPEPWLPYFLRAHRLEVARDWRGLLSLTDEWSMAENRNAEAWLFRGRGLVETQERVAARRAFQQAVALDPVSSAAWLQLGRLSAHDGQTTEAEDALAQLNRINPELAQCLAFEIRSASGPAQPDNATLDVCSQL
jgi:S1-C subfamily serine protease